MMTRIFQSNTIFSGLFLLLAVMIASPVPVACGAGLPVSGRSDADSDTGAGGNIGPSGLPLPRFVSLKSGKVNVRVGPEGKYALAWTYRRQGLPVEIIDEYDNWRRIRDSKGDTGWINQALLSGKRTVMVMAWQDKGEEAAPGQASASLADLYKQPVEDAAVVARVEPGVIGQVKTCDGHWCRLDINGYSGWLLQRLLWGVYPDEKI